MKNSGHIEVLVRGVCIKGGRLLLCQTKGDPNTYLPGGHVDFMEKATEGLCREIKEEIGLNAAVGRFLGTVEHTFIQQGERHCEINLVFEVDIPEIASAGPPSCEDHIEFLWASMSDLSKSNLEPAVLCDLLPSWLDHQDAPERWSTTY